MAVYVLVHGGWSGAHGFRHVRRGLAAAGHEVFTPSLTGIGERAHLASPIHAHFGEDALPVLHEDPYRLTEVDGVGFLRADRIALAGGVPPESDSRAQAAAAYVLAEAEQRGHTYMPLDELSRQVGRLLELTPDPDVLAAADGLLLDGERAYRRRTHECELHVARTLAARLAAPPQLEHDPVMVAKHRHQHFAREQGIERLPVDVEIRGVDRGRAVLEHVHPPGVVRAHDAHVIGNHVENVPHGVGAERAREMLVTTLHAMAAGGMYDHVGGGFARYSVDAYWHIPHFEKMLYDNAQLVRAYTHGWLTTHSPKYQRVVAETVAANIGIGSMMILAGSTFDVPLVFAGVFLLAVLGVAMYAIFAFIEGKVTFWARRNADIAA